MTEVTLFHYFVVMYCQISITLFIILTLKSVILKVKEIYL